MNRVFALLIVGTGLAASACASVPMASAEADQAAKRFAVPPDQASVYVYRNESFGGAVRMVVLLDGVALGDTAAKTFLYTPVAPGKHTILSKTENDSDLTIDAEPGTSYFVWQEVKMGIWTARSALQRVDDARGRAGVAECKLAKTNPPPAASGCSKDTDCKGARVCRAGSCVDAGLPID